MKNKKFFAIAIVSMFLLVGCASIIQAGRPVDTDPPVSRIRKIQDPRNGFRIIPGLSPTKEDDNTLAVIIRAKDDGGSGVKCIQYRTFDGTGWSSCKTCGGRVVAVKCPDMEKIKFRAKDWANNIESWKTANV